MKIFINNKEVIIHHGAKVLDVVRAYYIQHGKKLPDKLSIVSDIYGNSVALDGELNECNHLFIKKPKTEKT